MPTYKKFTLNPPIFHTDDDVGEGVTTLHFQMVNLADVPQRFADAIYLREMCDSLDEEMSGDLAFVQAAESFDERRLRIRGFMAKREERPPSSSWRQMAGVCGAIALFDAQRGIQTVQFVLDKDPKLRSAADVTMSEVQGALGDFNSHFPHATEVRDAVAHTADIFKLHKKNVRNGFTDTGAVVLSPTSFYQNSFEGSKFTTTWYNGKLVSYQLDWTAFDTLKAAIERVFNAFSGREEGQWRG